MFPHPKSDAPVSPNALSLHEAHLPDLPLIADREMIEIYPARYNNSRLVRPIPSRRKIAGRQFLREKALDEPPLDIIKGKLSIRVRQYFRNNKCDDCGR